MFVGLALPGRGLGPLYVAFHAWLGSAILPKSLGSGVELAFVVPSLGEGPWTLPLLVRPPLPQAPITIPIDLRALLFLPTACFIALALATPLASWRKNAKLLVVGVLILEPLLLVLSALPIVSFLGGTGPVRAFDLGRAAHVLLQMPYRALVAPPGMAFIIPLFLWWILLKKLSRLDARLAQGPSLRDGGASA